MCRPQKKYGFKIGIQNISVCGTDSLVMVTVNQPLRKCAGMSDHDTQLSKGNTRLKQGHLSNKKTHIHTNIHTDS